MKRDNALLESPTGTGKTLSLLCACLSWLQMDRDKKQAASYEAQMEGPTKIIYCSRTHSQLAQVQRECRRTVYKPRSVLVASRDQLCVNDDHKAYKGFVLNTRCEEDKSCQFYKSKANADSHMPWDPLNIEELHILAKKHTFCPYYEGKHRALSADLIFMPYNYLLDTKYRRSLKLEY